MRRGRGIAKAGVACPKRRCQPCLSWHRCRRCVQGHRRRPHRRCGPPQRRSSAVWTAAVGGQARPQRTSSRQEPWTGAQRLTWRVRRARLGDRGWDGSVSIQKTVRLTAEMTDGSCIRRAVSQCLVLPNSTPSRWLSNLGGWVEESFLRMTKAWWREDIYARRDFASQTDE